MGTETPTHGVSNRQKNKPAGESGLMESRTSSIHIETSVESAFDCVRNPDNFNDLMPGVAFRDIIMTPDGVGTRYRFETRVAGFTVRGTGEFTEVETNRRIHDETSIGVEGSFDWRFEPEGDGVRVTIEHHPGRHWGLPIVGRLLADSYERTDRQVLARLKAKLEADDSGRS
jgi:uncharacterized membrane protein